MYRITQENYSWYGGCCTGGGFVYGLFSCDVFETTLDNKNYYAGSNDYITINTIKE